MPYKLKSLASCAVVAAMLLSTGCGGEKPIGDVPDLIPVRGKVTLNGQPLGGVTVTFTPVGPDGGTSTGVTDGDGMYRLYYGPSSLGAVPGSHFVTLTAEETESEEEVVVEDVEGLSEAEQTDIYSTAAGAISIPPKYTNGEVELTANVKEGGGDIDFELVP